MNYEGKTVLVTGAAKGIGFCTAWEFGEHGAKVILVDLNNEALGQAFTTMLYAGHDVSKYCCDVSAPDQVRKLGQWVRDTRGQLDVLVNNAGIGYHGEIMETGLEEWKRLFQVNFWASLYMVYEFLPLLRESGGQLVNVSSGQVFFQLPTWGAYTVTKAAQAVFSEVLHFELAKRGVCVTTVYPFMVKTGVYEGVEGETVASRLAMNLLQYYSL